MLKDGFINVIKPTGMTSNDLVAKLRGMIKRGYGEKIKVGHTGTLDPNAAGVMLVSVGHATKFSKYVIEKKKTYIAEILFGTLTDTLDTYGQVEEQKNPKEHSEEEIQNALAEFRGKSLQIPPKFSALKIDGKRLYKLAREGKEIPEIEAREIEISKIELHSFAKNKITILVECSAGTYIRSLARDIGDFLDELAILSMLIRSEVDGQSIKHSYTMEELEELIAQKKLGQAIQTTENFLRRYPKLQLKGGQKLYCNGAKISARRYTGKNYPEGLYLVYDGAKFLGIGRVSHEEDCFLKADTLTR